MWPYTKNESEWLTRPEEAEDDFPHITPELIQHYIALGQQMRAQELARLARLGWAGLKSLVEGLRALRPAADSSPAKDWREHSPAA